MSARWSSQRGICASASGVLLFCLACIAFGRDDTDMKHMEAALANGKAPPAALTEHATRNPEVLQNYVTSRLLALEQPLRTADLAVMAEMTSMLPAGSSRTHLLRKILDLAMTGKARARNDIVAASLCVLQAEPQVLQDVLAATQKRIAELQNAKEPADVNRRMNYEVFARAAIRAIARGKHPKSRNLVEALRASSRGALSGDADFCLKYLDGSFPARHYRHSDPESLVQDYSRFLRENLEGPYDTHAEFWGWDREPDRLAHLRRYTSRHPDERANFSRLLQRVRDVPRTKWRIRKAGEGRTPDYVVYYVPGARGVRMDIEQDVAGDWYVSSIQWSDEATPGEPGVGED